MGVDRHGCDLSGRISTNSGLALILRACMDGGKKSQILGRIETAVYGFDHTAHQPDLRSLQMTHKRPARGLSLVEIGITIAVIGIMVVVLPRGLASMQIAAELELQQQIANKLAEGELAAALNVDYQLLQQGTKTQPSASVLFEEGRTEHLVTFQVERNVEVDTSLGAGREFKVITVRVSWPEGDNPVGEAVRVSMKSQD